MTSTSGRYLDAYRPELMEQFIRENVEWGLHSDEILTEKILGSKVHVIRKKYSNDNLTL